MAERLREI